MEDPEILVMIGEEPMISSEIVEAPLISPDYPRYKTTILDYNGTVLGYALECEDSDLDICVYKKFYKGPLWPQINKKAEEILSKVNCATYRLVLINENEGTEHIIINFTNSI